MIARALAAALVLACAGAAAAPLRTCDRAPVLTAAQQDRLFAFAAFVRGTLDHAVGQGGAALVARSGQKGLARFGERHSHEGVALRAGPMPWTVRQLYFDCDEKLPRIFDQGVAGFVFGTDDADVGYVSIVVLPPEPAQRLAQRAADDGQALALLGSDYSANAYPWSVRYQNCNQWVAEMLAAAWGGLEGAAEPRAAAQRWLRDAGYVPHTFDVSTPWLALAEPFVPWVRTDDHPPEDRAARVYRVSMPSSIEAFVAAQVPGATRIELCHAGARAVVHRGWTPVGEGCVPAADDVVVPLS